MNLPNKISITRVILVPFFIASIVYSRMGLALIFFVIAIISDGVDGFIARMTNQKTRLGTVLDPMADKLLLVSAFICLSIVKSIPAHFKMPPYVPIVIISRDAIIILGSVMIYFITGDLKIEPTISGKITTFFQMMTIVCILVQFPCVPIIWNITVLLTVISAIDYILKGSRAFNENNSTSKKAPQP